MLLPPAFARISIVRSSCVLLAKRYRPCTQRAIPSVSSSLCHSCIPSSASSFRSFSSSRPPDSFDEINDRDQHLRPVSERGLTQAEFDALPAEEQEEIRQSELDLITAEELMQGRKDEARLRSGRPVSDEDEEEEEGGGGDFDLDLDDFTATSVTQQATEQADSLASLPPPSSSSPAGAVAADSTADAETYSDDYVSPIPEWVHMQTQNPEFIPPLPGSDPAVPTSVRYPFIPVLGSADEIDRASTVHRLLQYERLSASREFIALERRRRLLQAQRRYRDLGSSLLPSLLARLPAERTDLKDVKPPVRNLPDGLSREQLESSHPHGIPTDVSFMPRALHFMEAELRMNGVLSTREKERLLVLAVKHLSWLYRRMMADKEKGYYRIMMGGLDQSVHDRRKQEQDERERRVPTRQISSALRVGRVRARGGAEAEQ